MSNKVFNKNNYNIKERIVKGIDYDFEKGLGNQYNITDEEMDSIVEKIVTETDRNEMLEPFSENIIPKGKNSLRTRKLYYQRRYYDEHAFPKPAGSQNEIDGSAVDDNNQYQGVSRNIFIPFQHVDFVHQKALYGRIDTNNRSIYPSEKFLKLVNGTENVFLLNFVADALNDMKSKIEILKETNKIPESSVYFDFSPKKGWESFLQDHHKTMRSIFDSFITKYVTNPSMFTKITNYDEYTRQFVFFLNRFLPKFPITRTNMQLRRSTNPRISGIVFELSKEKHDDDEKKYTKYILDKHFLQIQNIANGYGFMVDRNAPWRFVADLESPQMKARMLEKGFETLQDMFDAYYYKTHLYEVNSLKNYFNSFYDSFVEGYPYYTKVSACGDGSKAKLLYRQKRNKSPFTDKKLLEFYYYIRAKEGIKDWNQEYFDLEFEEANQIFHEYGFVAALDYINDRTTHIIGKGGNPGIRTKNSEGERIISNHQSSHKRTSFTITL